MSKIVVMPKAHWVATLDSVRKKTNTTAKIKSGDLAKIIDNIATGEGGEGETPKTVKVSIYNNTSTWMYVDFTAHDGDYTFGDFREIYGSEYAEMDCVCGSYIFIQTDEPLSLAYYDGSCITMVFAEGNRACFKVNETAYDGAYDTIMISTGSIPEPDVGGGETRPVSIFFEEGGHTNAKLHYTGIDENGVIRSFVLENVGVNYGDTYEFNALKGSTMIFEGFGSFWIMDGDPPIIRASAWTDGDWANGQTGLFCIIKVNNGGRYVVS